MFMFSEHWIIGIFKLRVFGSLNADCVGAIPCIYYNLEITFGPTRHETELFHKRSKLRTLNL